MNSLHPVVILGSHYWNQELLPRDEFAERMRAARALMKTNGWDGLVVFGDCAEPGMLAWLTNVCPRMRWTAALIGQSGEPTLLVPGAVRDFPMTAVMTWITDIRSWGAIAKVLPEWAKALVPPQKPVVAVYGSERMTPSQHAAVTQALSPVAEMKNIDRQLDSLLARTRPREAYLIRQGCTVLESATGAFRSASAKGARPGEAALEAERTARMNGAHDVRILLGRDRGRNLEPFFSVDVPKDGPSLAYIALRFLGYWTEALVTADAPNTALASVEAALKGMISEAKAGASRKSIASAAAAHLKGLEPHPVFGAPAVKRVGLSLDESLFGQDADDALQPGAVYSLRVAACGPDGAAASALVRDGALLWGPA